MASKVTTNTFTKGMNKDLDKSIRPNSTYLHAENFRVTSSDAGTSGAIENVKGNTLSIDIDDINGNGTARIEAGQYIIGSVRVRDWLVVFTTNVTYQTTYASGDESHIYAFPLISGNISDDADHYINPGLDTNYRGKIYDSSDFDANPDVLYNNLKFGVFDRIKAIGRYESDTVAKVYWTDNRNNLRWVNILDTNVETQMVDRFDLIPDAALPKAEIETLSSGNLKSGRVQYTYQLYKAKGSETLFAPLSDLISLTADNENLGNSQHYEGSEFDASTGKGVRISIDNQNIGYNFIRGIAVHYTTLNTTPTIRVFDEQSIDDTAASTITLTDGGDVLGTYEFEELSVLDRSIFKAKDIATKNNYLFAANIEEDTFDIGTYDTRAYRFISGTKTCELQQDVTDSNYYECDVGSATIETSTWTSVGSPGASLSGDPITDIPETANCMNYYNDYDFDGTGNHQFKCQFNSTTLGASGYNIDIDVEMEIFRIDHDYTRFPHYVGAASGGTDPEPFYQQTETETDNTSYTGNASPYIASKYPGYAHDEIYRFGVVFDDAKGRSSYARWICDLRMPHMNETIHGNNSTIAYTSSVYTRARTLYPQFKIKNMPDDAVSYQIVRVKREGFEDRNILAQGLLSANRLTGTDEYPVLTEDSDRTNVSATEYVWLTSPEIVFNKNLSYSSGDHLVVMASLDTTDTDDFRRNTNISSVTFNKVIAWDGISIVTDSVDVIDTAVISSPADTTYNLGGTNTVNVLDSTLTGDYFKGTSLLVKRSGDTQTAAVSAASDGGGGEVTLATADTGDLAAGDTVVITGTTDYNGTFEIQSLIADTSFNITDTWVDNQSGTWTAEIWEPAKRFSDDDRFLCSYRRNNWLTQYGGNTYEARARNIYISSGDIVLEADIDSFYPDLTGPDYTSMGGDSYITIFDYVDAIPDIGNGVGFYHLSNVFVPVESTINCDLRHDISSINKVMDGTTGDYYRRTQETGGLNIDADDNEYEQTTDLYLYNTVYSQENTAVSHIAKPVDALYSLTDVFDTRIKYSNAKVDGEVSDSWVRFGTDNYTDLDKEYGPINNIRLYKDNLIFWQDRAFGAVAVNERALFNTDSGTGLVLGTGGLLDHIDYISRENGNINRFGIAVTDTSCYWIDNDHKELMKFSSGVRGMYSLRSSSDPLSTAKGMGSYLKGISYIGDVETVVDQMNNEVLFTIYPSREGVTGKGVNTDIVTGSWTGVSQNEIAVVDGRRYLVANTPTASAQLRDLDFVYTTGGNTVYYAVEADKATFSFNEIINAFGSFYSFTPGIYMDCFNYFFSTEEASTAKGYLHDSGNYCEFYDNTPNNSSITVTFNPDYPNTKVFDNLIWYSEVTDESGANPINQFSDTFMTIQVYNDYQNSGTLDLAYKTVVGATDVVYDRRERGFNLALPRNAVDTDVSDNPDIFTAGNIDQTQNFKGRIRDKYSIMVLTYDNVSSYRFVCPYLSMKYRSSIR